MALHAIEHPTQGSTQAGRIGPNAVMQTVQALRELYGPTATSQVLAHIGRPDLSDFSADSLIDEREFVSLHHALIDALGLAEASRVLARAGTLTSQYVVHNRIPRPAQRLLRLLPSRLALRLLLRAISQHAWTFAGSGAFGYTLGRTPQLTLEDSLTARNLSAEQCTCTFYAAAFQGFFTTLIDPRLRVHEARCAACGAARCEFVVVGEVTQ